MVEFPPCYSEESCEFALCHGNVSAALANYLHTATPIKITALIVYAYFSFGIIDCLHAVSSILQVTISEGSQASLSANRLQKDFTKVVNLAFKNLLIVVKSRFYNDFSLYIPLSPDGITLCFDNHHSVKFCYINCYTKIVAIKNVAMTGF